MDDTPSRETVEKKIGTTMKRLYSAAIGVEEMLALTGYNPNQQGSIVVETIRNEVYKDILQYLRVEGHDILMDMHVNDLVLFTIVPVIDMFMQRTGIDTAQLFRKKKQLPVIMQPQPKEGGSSFMQYTMQPQPKSILVDKIKITEETYVIIIEATKSLLDAAMDQCLLAMWTMGGSNLGGAIYGFVTTGDSWRMLRYSDATFKVTNKIEVVFDSMGRDEKRWMKDFSVIVDCVYAALWDSARRCDKTPGNT